MPGKKDTKKKSKIPVPPGPKASADVREAYFSKYSLEDLEEAGYVSELTEKDSAWIKGLSKIAKERVEARKSRKQLNLALSSDQLMRFTNYANKKHIPPSTLARAWVLERLDKELKEVL